MHEHGHPTPQAAQAPPLLAWSRTFPANAQQVGEARRFLATLVEGCPAADDALLCLSELATNALLHSSSREPGGRFTVRAQRQGNHLRVEVCDQGGPWAPPALAEPGELNGRGLAIVDQLARIWGRSGGETGWTVWFEIGRSPAQRWTTLLDGRQLRQLRRHQALTQAELATKAGVSSATVTRLESGTRMACRCRTLARLAAALGTTPATLTLHPSRASSQRQATTPETATRPLPGR